MCDASHEWPQVDERSLRERPSSDAALLSALRAGPRLDSVATCFCTDIRLGSSTVEQQAPSIVAVRRVLR